MPEMSPVDPYTREGEAALAFNVLMACWRHGFIVTRSGGTIRATGGYPGYARIANALVSRWQRVLKHRTPGVVA